MEKREWLISGNFNQFFVNLFLFKPTDRENNFYMSEKFTIRYQKLCMKNGLCGGEKPQFSTKIIKRALFPYRIRI